MADVTHVEIDELDAIDGFFKGIKFHKAAAGLGISSFGMSIIDLYIALRGSGTVEADGEQYEIDADHIVRLGPAVKRKVTPGPDGLRLLALGATPGEAYDPGGTL